MSSRQPTGRVKLNREAVWEHLVRRNMDQNELARRAEISSGYLSLLMNGKRCPSAEVRARLQRELGISRFDDLFLLEWDDGNEAGSDGG